MSLTGPHWHRQWRPEAHSHACVGRMCRGQSRRFWTVTRAPMAHRPGRTLTLGLVSGCQYDFSECSRDSNM